MLSKAIVLSAILSVAFAGYTFPDDFESCNSTSDSSCLIDLMQDALTKLGTDGVSSPIDFSIANMDIAFWRFNVDVDAVKEFEYFYNISHPNVWNSTVTAATFNSSDLTLTFTTYTEHLIQWNDYYELWGQLNYGNDTEPEAFFGNGSADKHFHDVVMEHSISFFTADLGGTDYYFVKSYDLDITNVVNVTFNFHNLYNGNTTKAERASTLINDNAMIITDQQVGVFTELLVTMFKRYTQKLISSVPASQILAHLSG